MEDLVGDLRNPGSGPPVTGPRRPRMEEAGTDRVLLVSPGGQVLSGKGSRHIEYSIHTQIMRARPGPSSWPCAAGDPKVWSDPAEAALKREQIWNPAGIQAGWR